MKTTAIVAEYNPFHFGHAYQLKEARRQTGADCIVVLMSGNIVQRGEFAILDKWQRAELALGHGADLVLELPLEASLQAADYFAFYAMEVVKAIGVDHLVFGTESAGLQDLLDYHDFVVNHQPLIDAKISGFIKEGFSYSKAHQLIMDQALEGEDREFNFDPHLSNHILAIQYLKHLQGSGVQPLAIRRCQDPDQLAQALDLPKGFVPEAILSASQIRSLPADAQALRQNLPLASWHKLSTQPQVTWSDYFPLLRYAILSSGPGHLRTIQSVDEGFEKVIYQKALESNSWQDLVQSLVSPRWTRLAIQRKLLQILLHLTKEEWQDYLQLRQATSPIRILAFNQQGRSFLTGFQSERIKLFSNLSKVIEPAYRLMLRADRVYQVNLNHQLEDQIIARHPIHRPF